MHENEGKIDFICIVCVQVKGRNEEYQSFTLIASDISSIDCVFAQVAFTVASRKMKFAPVEDTDASKRVQSKGCDLMKINHNL